MGPVLQEVKRMIVAIFRSPLAPLQKIKAIKTTTALSHAPVDKGSLGFVLLVDPRAALQVSHTWQMPHSPDKFVREIGQEHVWQVIQKRFVLNPDHWRGWVPDAIQLFLNGELDSSPYARQKRKSGDIGLLWVDVKEHLAARVVKLTAEPVHTEGNVEVEMLLQLKVPHGPQPLTCKDTTRRF
ncbi:hypothetical protein PC116_g9347 [Phytophthora cactorum]|uniref:Uncharacterized protein n=2 Tax=Phytophthora cactorum TaxID=29920 RepID=A0A329SXF9_9STRA|nr:hypothetical protein PC112_g6509 [Phytophthora cactorum]KAG2918815.1 hypothetical protein PC114_g6696 [Phytophthora cactorum]KAG2932719.1 hypothetical protein PC115_g5697 [Phytophthora cactorum]KAG2947811.1 hypothetical protein PC117_g6506 [Phytophthora cactorum]KAG2991209.1 hypothetical protein PC118_g5203 [Phytophthora cactorum]